MSDKVHEEVRKYYGAIAAQGSSCCESAECDCRSNHYDVALLDEVPSDIANLSLGCGDPVTIAALKPGETVLDLGSGAGLDCFFAARKVGPQGQVIGLDMTPEMLAKAEANRTRLGLENVEFRKGQIEAMPLEDASVDVIMSNCVINLSPDKAAVFREAYRVLRPGGRVAVSDIVTQGEFSQTMREQAGLWSSCVSGAIDVADYTGLMARAGFTDIQVEEKQDVSVELPVGEAAPRVFSARITATKAAAQ